MSLEDNEWVLKSWVLKSWNQDGVGTMKVLCMECRKEFGSDNGNHSNVVIANLFSNFQTSHFPIV